MNKNHYRTLISTPTSDGNYTYALKRYATIEDLTRAEEYLTANPANNKSRLAAVKAEIKRRNKTNE